MQQCQHILETQTQPNFPGTPSKKKSATNMLLVNVDMKKNQRTWGDHLQEILVMSKIPKDNDIYQALLQKKMFFSRGGYQADCIVYFQLGAFRSWDNTLVHVLAPSSLPELQRSTSTSGYHFAVL